MLCSLRKVIHVGKRHLSYESVSVLTCLCFCQGLNKKPAQSPSEVIHLPSDANMADLKREAFSKFRSMYWTIRCMHNSSQLINVQSQLQTSSLNVTSGDHPTTEQASKSHSRKMDNRTKVASFLSSLGDEKVVLLTTPEASGKSAAQNAPEVLFQSGREEWQVRCLCGARDDDGRWK